MGRSGKQQRGSQVTTTQALLLSQGTVGETQSRAVLCCWGSVRLPLPTARTPAARGPISWKKPAIPRPSANTHTGHRAAALPQAALLPASPALLAGVVLALGWTYPSLFLFANNKLIVILIHIPHDLLL